jgi:hypothetical protein
VQPPSVFTVIVDLETAEARRLALPPTILLRPEEVIA